MVDTRLWNDADRRQVAALLINGISANDIGALLGLTRNATIGRIHRDETLADLMRRNHHARRKPRHERLPAPPAQLPPPRAPVAITPPPQTALMIPFADLARGQCKWPIAFDLNVDGHYLCCGLQVAPDQVYCVTHHATAHTTPRREVRHG